LGFGFPLLMPALAEKHLGSAQPSKLEVTPCSVMLAVACPLRSLRAPPRKASALTTGGRGGGRPWVTVFLLSRADPTSFFSGTEFERIGRARYMTRTASTRKSVYENELRPLFPQRA